MYKGTRAPTHDARTEKQKRCEHRWDHLAVTGGWGAAGTFQVHCEECDLQLQFDVDDALPSSSSSSPELRTYLNDKATKFERRHASKKKAAA